MAIIPSLLCFDFKMEHRFDMALILLCIIPIKQLTGYSYVSTIWRVLVALIPFILILIALFLMAIVLLSLPKLFYLQ